MSEVRKAIIPLAGLGTRLLPLSKAFPKELFPLVDRPLLHYAIAEAKEAGVEEIIFVAGASKKAISDYLKRSLQLEKLLEEHGKKDLLEDLRSIEELMAGLNVSYVTDKPLGDGHAVLQAKKLVGDAPCFILYPDDVIDAKIARARQLEQVFRTSKKPTLALFRLPLEKLSSYGVVATDKMANRLHNIRKIVEKPAAGTAPSSFALAGRSIITPDVFYYLKKTKPNKKGEVSLTETFAEMVKDGKIIYGYECEGKWLECGNIQELIKSFCYLACRHPKYGKEVRAFLHEERL